MKLTDRFDSDVIVLSDKQIKLRLFFDVVLRSFELLKDDRFNQLQKIDILVDMFVENREEAFTLTRQEKALLVGAIFSKFVSPDAKTTTEKPTYDLQKDAEYIYASFLFDYNIDLFEQQGKMHWNKFKALLANLSDESKFKKVIGYRTMKIPAQNKYNTEEVKRLRELKRTYALETVQTAEDIDRMFDSLANTLRPKGGESVE